MAISLLTSVGFNGRGIKYRAEQASCCDQEEDGDLPYDYKEM